MKTVAIVQARMGSTRLPGKVLMQAGGQPMLGHLLDRLRTCAELDEIWVATTDQQEDDAIAAFCRDRQTRCFRGSSEDVLSRFVFVAQLSKAHHIVRITGDCPLMDPAVVDRVVAFHHSRQGALRYTSNTLVRSYPRGMDVEVMSCELLDKLNRVSTSAYDREHVTSKVTRSEVDGVDIANQTSSVNWSALRFTLDYPKDYKQISALIGSGLSNWSQEHLVEQAQSLHLDWRDNTNPEFSDSVHTILGPHKHAHRLGLGTAQFGMFYGRFNRDGVPSVSTVAKLLERASGFGMSVIDTASQYGQAEEVLGKNRHWLAPFRVCTKIPALKDIASLDQQLQVMQSSLEASLDKLQTQALDTVLMHHAADLLTPQGERLYERLVSFREKGWVRHVGVSVYSGSQAWALHQRMPMDVVQLPINVLDRRSIEDGSLKQLACSGVQVHARSVFLQGLLLADPDKLPAFFDPVRPLLRSLRSDCAQSGISVAHAALHFLLSLPEISHVVVGVESTAQFDDLFAQLPEHIEMDWSRYSLGSEEILNPVQWVS